RVSGFYGMNLRQFLPLCLLGLATIAGAGGQVEGVQEEILPVIPEEISGGTSSNGGGGDEPEPGWQPMGDLGRLMMNAQGPSYEDRLASFSQVFPEVKMHT